MHKKSLFDKLAKGSNFTSAGDSKIDESFTFKSKKQIVLILELLDRYETYTNKDDQFIESFIEYVQPFIEKQDSCNNKEYIQKKSEYLRISYNEISKYIYAIDKEKDRIEAIKYNLDLIISNTTLDYSIRKIAAKIFDHIELCNTQAHSFLTYFSELDNLNHTFSEKLEARNKEIKAQIKKSDNILEKLESKLFTQVFTIVSILSGLAFVLFGGITLIDKLSEFSLSSVDGYWFSVSYLSLTGTILIGLIYTLLNFIVNILDRFNNKDKKEILDNSIFRLLFTILFTLFLFSSIGGLILTELPQTKLDSNYHIKISEEPFDEPFDEPSNEQQISQKIILKY